MDEKREQSRSLLFLLPQENLAAAEEEDDECFRFPAVGPVMSLGWLTWEEVPGVAVLPAFTGQRVCKTDVSAVGV